MNWILDHLQIVIAAAAAIAYWLNQGRKGTSENDPGREEPQSDFGPPGHSDPDEAIRTRRIQEEIRRKIAERASGGPIHVPPPAPEPPPLFRENNTAPRPVASPLPQWELRREPVPPPAATARILERQREMAEQMRALEESRRTAQRSAAAVAPVAVPPVSPARGELLSELRGAKNLRRAMVLREVLGPPVALR